MELAFRTTAPGIASLLNEQNVLRLGTWNLSCVPNNMERQHRPPVVLQTDLPNEQNLLRQLYFDDNCIRLFLEVLLNRT